jgi:hypothetical protein
MMTKKVKKEDNMPVKEHLTCPACGKGEGEMHKMHKKAVEDKVMGANPNFQPATEVGVHVSFDLLHPPIIGGEVPAMRTFKDTCEECGAVWSFRVEHGVAKYTGDARQPFAGFKITE